MVKAKIKLKFYAHKDYMTDELSDKIILEYKNDFLEILREIPKKVISDLIKIEISDIKI